MRQAFFKVLPYAMGGVIGIVIGILIVSPSAAMRAFGPFSGILVWLFLGLALLAVVMIQLFVALPAKATAEPAPGETVPAEVQTLLDRFEALGFELGEIPFRVHLRPTAILWPMIHRSIGCTGSVFTTGTLPRRTSFEIVTRIEDDRGALSTSPHFSGATLPLPRGHFKQIVQGASPEVLFQNHRRGAWYLETQGVRFEAPRLDDAREQIERSIARVREAALANPIRSACVALWRVVTRSSPYTLPLERQKGVAAAVRQLAG
jgi:hypothetical protein